MPEKTEKLRNPQTGTVREFTARRARVRKRHGWVPAGAGDSVEQVLADVAGDPDKARETLEREQAKASPRKTLIAKLEKIAG